MRAPGHHDRRDQERLRPDRRRRGARAARWPREVTDETTFLGAHVVPPECARRPRGLRRPRHRRRCSRACAPHARWIDVFCEPARRLRRRRGPRGARGRAAMPGSACGVHGNQLGRRAGRAARRRARAPPASTTAPTSTDADVDALAGRRHTVATLLPGVEFSTRSPYPDARRLLDAGVDRRAGDRLQPRAPATRRRCRSCIALAVREMRMTPAEALVAGHGRRRRALRRADVGRGRRVRAPTWRVLDAPSLRAPRLPPGRAARPSPGVEVAMSEPLSLWNPGPTRDAVLAFVDRRHRPGHRAPAGGADRRVRQRRHPVVREADADPARLHPAPAASRWCRRTRAWPSTQPWKAAAERDYGWFGSGARRALRRRRLASCRRWPPASSAPSPTSASTTSPRRPSRSCAARRTPPWAVATSSAPTPRWCSCSATSRTTASPTSSSRAAVATSCGRSPPRSTACRASGSSAAPRRWRTCPTTTAARSSGRPRPTTSTTGPRSRCASGTGLGRRPVLAGGNSNGDIEMLDWTRHPTVPTLRLLVLHDDAEREFDYVAGSETALERAAAATTGPS